MKITSFYSEGELSPMRVRSADETVLEVKNLFFQEQLEEEEIRAAVYCKDKSTVSEVDELRLDFDRIISRSFLLQLRLGRPLIRIKMNPKKRELPLDKLLMIKNEQRYLNARFRNLQFFVCRKWLFFGPVVEEYVLASLNNKMYYVIGGENPIFT